MAQLLLMNADRELQLYVSPVNWKPDAPPIPMSYPAGFSGELFDKIGYYRTLGWAEATWPLNEARMDEQTFMDDLYKAFDDRAQVILTRLAAQGMGPHGRRHRIDRSSAAHDVAAHRSEASDVRPGTRGEVRRRD